MFYVRDIDGALANAKKANAAIVTTGGEPVEIATAKGKARSIVIRDPDGFFIQLIQETPAEGAPQGNVHRVSLAYTMENADATRAFYTGKLGIELTGSSAYSKDPAMLQLVGAPAGTEFRKLSGVIPGPPASVEFTEFRGVPRTKFHLRVRDPGAPAMCIQVNDETATIGQMKAAGVNIISANGEIVDFGGGTHTIFVEDPNGMNLEIFERRRRKARVRKRSDGTNEMKPADEGSERLGPLTFGRGEFMRLFDVHSPSRRPSCFPNPLTSGGIRLRPQPSFPGNP